MATIAYHDFPTLASVNPLKRHVFYTGEPLADGKIDKQPLNPRNGRPASNTKAATWGSHADAIARAKAIRKPGWKPGVGVVLGPLDDDVALCGVDFDGCLKGGVLEPWAEAIADLLNTYVEISPSGNGVKAFFRVTMADLAALRKETGIEHKGSWMRGGHYGVELHLSATYYAVTGEPYGDASALIGDFLRVVPLADLRNVVKAAERFKGKSNATGKAGSASGRPFNVVRDALFAIPNDGSNPDVESRDQWLDIGMALRHASNGSEEGLAAWHEWSALWPGYDEAKTTDAWHSFRRSTGRVRTGQFIINMADRHGWRDLDRIFALYDAIEPEGGYPEDELPGGFAMDEDGVIRAFTHRHADELKFDHHAGKWFRFDGNYWKREETKLAHHYARTLALDIIGDAKGVPAKALKRVSTWEAVERGARTVREFAVTSDEWNRDKMLLGTPGGTVELDTGTVRAGNPADHISRVTAVAPIPLDQFDAERDCPLWLAFLDTALAGDADAVRFLQQWGGYSLSGETKEQVLVFVYGPGGSGKGTAINTIGDILCDYGITVGMETLTASKHDRHTTELARLHGARMARASETEKGRAWAENRIKNLTGQDTITARFMRQDDFEFVPEFKLTIFGNNRPSLRDVDSAIKRRFIVLPFDHPPAERDPELPDKLRAEWPGILSWLIVGCLDWQAHGLVRPAVVEEATAAYFEQEDTFGQWLADCCEIGPRLADTTDALWDSWHGYAYDLGEEAGSKNKTFPETLIQRGFNSVRDTGGIRGRGFKGLRIHPDKKVERDAFI